MDFLKVIAKPITFMLKATPTFILYFYFLLGEPNYPETKTCHIPWVVFLALKFEVKSKDRDPPGVLALASVDCGKRKA